MLSQKVILLFALLALGFVGSFLLSLVLPNLILGSNGASAISIAIGVQDMRLILFFASCVCLFGIGPYLIFNSYKIMRLEAVTTHYIRNKLQVVILDIENASTITTDTETLKVLSHAFEACQDMVSNLPKQIDREASSFNAIKIESK